MPALIRLTASHSYSENCRTAFKKTQPNTSRNKLQIRWMGISSASSLVFRIITKFNKFSFHSIIIMIVIIIIQYNNNNNNNNNSHEQGFLFMWLV